LRYTLFLMAALVGGCAPPSPQPPSTASTAANPQARPCNRAAAEGHAAAAFLADTTLPADQREPGGGIRPTSRVWPRYPHELRAQGVEGSVRSTFVIDTLGHVVPASAYITYESRREFGDAVCTWLRQSRFAPLVVDGRRRSVRLLEVPTTFELMR
jgi:outer membrane biosynthesis protein TonB